MNLYPIDSDLNGPNMLYPDFRHQFSLIFGPILSRFNLIILGQIDRWPPLTVNVNGKHRSLQPFTEDQWYQNHV
ncbi:unnamed protein product [Linum trigynum]|uniref:Uncharacterized protein n=1 Tax=Linum trigynum TaxID=586398 RepID=A0AAV2GVG1_9ROSI